MGSDATLNDVTARPGGAADAAAPPVPTVATVAAIAMTPVKGFGLSSPAAVTLDEGGVFENRRFVVLDASGRPLTGPRHGALMRWRAEYDPERQELRARRPDGGEVTGTVTPGRPVRLKLWAGVVDARVVSGPWAKALSADLGREVALARVEAGASASDVHAVSLISTASLSRLGDQAGEPVDGRRFRMLFTLDGCHAHEEDTWVGRSVSLGAATIRVVEAVGRCAVTSLDPEDGSRSRNMLKVIESYRGVSTRRSVDFGVYATVERPGTVRVGDRAQPVP